MLKMPKKSSLASLKCFLAISYCFTATLPSTFEMGVKDNKVQLGIQLSATEQTFRTDKKEATHCCSHRNSSHVGMPFIVLARACSVL